MAVRCARVHQTLCSLVYNMSINVYWSYQKQLSDAATVAASDRMFAHHKAAATTCSSVA